MAVCGSQQIEMCSHIQLFVSRLLKMAVAEKRGKELQSESRMFHTQKATDLHNLNMHRGTAAHLDSD